MKPKIWTFWVPALTSVGIAKYIKFVRKCDYDKLAKELVALKKSLE